MVQSAGLISDRDRIKLQKIKEKEMIKQFSVIVCIESCKYLNEIQIRYYVICVSVVNLHFLTPVLRTNDVFCGISYFYINF